MKRLRSIKRLKLSSNSLATHKMRTLSALMAIAIGVAAVIIMVSIGEGAQQEMLGNIEKMGSNLLTIKAGQVRKVIGRERQYGDVTTLTLRDADAITEKIPSVTAVAPTQDRTLRIIYGNTSTRTQVVGTSPQYTRLRSHMPETGRFFTQTENKAGLRVVVLGSDVWKHLFKNQDPIGEIVRIGKIPFQVIGVLESKGVSPEGGNADNQVYIPIRTALRRVFNVRHLKVIYAQVSTKPKMKQAEKEVRQLLRRRHRLDRRQKSDDFSIRNQVTVLEMERASGESFTFLIAGVAGITLLVGGIGILAIMLLSVRERTGEIGLRRAVGARSRDIMIQFLYEALMISLAGGIAGIAIGVSGSWLIESITKIPMVTPIHFVLLSTLFSLLLGITFGVYPAQQAASLDPIAALRAD